MSREARGKLTRIAGHLLQCPPEDVVLQNGRALNSRDLQRNVTFAQLASAAHREEQLPPGIEVGLDFSGSFTPGRAYQSPHSFSTHVVVEVNPDTSETKIVRYVALHDCGRIINPALVDGQVHGGIVQGIGQALWEGMAYDDAGQPLTGSFMDASAFAT